LGRRNKERRELIEILDDDDNNNLSDIVCVKEEAIQPKLEDDN
jgi:hypothetical protein